MVYILGIPPKSALYECFKIGSCDCRYEGPGPKLQGTRPGFIGETDGFKECRGLKSIRNTGPVLVFSLRRDYVVLEDVWAAFVREIPGFFMVTEDGVCGGCMV